MIEYDVIQSVKKLIAPMMLKVTLKGGEVGLINPMDAVCYTEVDFAGDDGNKVINVSEIQDINLVKE